MNQVTIEEILDSAIEELAQGQNLEAVLAKYPEHTEELSGILSMIQPAISLPKNSIPTPTRTYRYTTSLHVPWQERLQRIARLLMIPATAVFIFVGGTQLVVAAQHSLPGETLYKFKLAAERTRVAITTDQNDKAHLELAYSQKRLVDVQTVLENKDSSPDQQAEALNELKEQTQKTFALVPTVATSNAINNNDDTLFKGLIAVNNQQKDLLKTLPDQEETKEIASTTLQVTEDHEKTLTTLLAAVNDKTLIDLVDQEISITGVVTSIDLKKQTVLVENNSFTINESTEINYLGKPLTLSNLPAKTKITITGNKQTSGIVAESIDVITLAVVPTKPGEVKGAVTGIVSGKPANTDQTPTTETTPEPVDPNTVVGGYIIEQPEE